MGSRLLAEWPYDRHVESRVAVRAVRPERSSASGSAVHTATRYRSYRIGTPKGRVAVRSTWPECPRAEWKCSLHCHSTVNVRGGTFRHEWQCTWHAQGPSGSAAGTLKREWQCAAHCHSVLNIRGLHVQARVAVWMRQSLDLRSGMISGSEAAASVCFGWGVPGPCLRWPLHE